MNEERKRILSLLAKGKISEQEAEELIEAIGKDDRAEVRTDAASPTQPRNVKYIYVKVQSRDDDNVDVRVPLGLIRAGMRLTSLIPAPAVERINSAMREKGMTFDFNSIKPDDIEELVKNIADMEVNVKSKNGDTVRVYCDK
jgi:hypothetical protein